MAKKQKNFRLEEDTIKMLSAILKFENENEKAAYEKGRRIGTFKEMSEADIVHHCIFARYRELKMKGVDIDQYIIENNQSYL